MTMKKRPALSLLEAIGSVTEAQIYKNFAIHLFVLIPATGLLAWLATRLDRRLGWGTFGSIGYRLPLAVCCVLFGALVVIYSYAYLLRFGEGSPGSHLGGPRRLVTGGPYALVRHPSVIGKLLGVVGLGLLVGSSAFLLIFIPVLLLYSLATNRWLQERYCERAFGDGYRRYRRAVPMIFPGPRRLIAWLHGRLPEIEAWTGEAAPGSIPRYELAIYLALLAGLLAVAGLAVWLVVVLR